MQKNKSIICLALAAGCAGKPKHQIQKKFAAMSDRGLLNHYEMLEMRMVDIDRAREQSQNENRELPNATIRRTIKTS